MGRQYVVPNCWYSFNRLHIVITQKFTRHYICEIGMFIFTFIKSKHVHQVKLCASWVLITGLPNTPSQAKWLTKTLRPGSRVGADPDLVKYSIWKPLQTDLEAGGLFLVPVTTNLIDLIWEDRPSIPCNVIQPLPVKYTGRREWFTSL
jgi:Xaa-Pro aminopeptidase